MTRIPKWKQRQLKAKAELDKAERDARYKAFWAAVPEPKRKTVDFDRGLPIG
jgi:hypothetical protein